MFLLVNGALIPANPLLLVCCKDALYRSKTWGMISNGGRYTQAKESSNCLPYQKWNSQLYDRMIFIHTYYSHFALFFFQLRRVRTYDPRHTKKLPSPNA